MNIILLTKDNCPQCTALKRMLSANPKTKAILEKVKQVHETENPEEYKELTTKHNIMSMPALLVGDKVINQSAIPMELMKNFK